jgi:S-adenosylmethionine-diacylgycerolhomoserine-N-methlytransferase
MVAAYPVAESATAAGRMNRLYGRQRYIYNFTRKYYLLGRDLLIERLNAGSGDSVLEIGCGTGRNLVRAASRYPHAKFFGIDISTEMLMSAKQAIDRRRLSQRVFLAEADATAIDMTVLFGRAQYQRVFISYSLSIIPNWRSVLPLAYSLLLREGELHIIDFGDFDPLPPWVGHGMRHWLARFDVVPCDELECDLTELAWRTHAKLNFERLYGGYAQYAMVKRV